MPMTLLPTEAEEPETADWYHRSAEEVLERVGSSATGLSPQEAAQRLTANGPNVLKEGKPPSALRILAGQFKNLITWVLLAAGVLSGVLGELVDALSIFAIVVLNAANGFYQEFSAERSIAALKKLTSPRAKVRRAGQVTEVSAAGIVVGDVLLLEAGDLVAADARLLKTASLKCIESALTGESVAVPKQPETLQQVNLPLGDRENLVFQGTSVAAGTGQAVVVATESKTEMGHIAQLLDAADTEKSTPLQQKLDAFGRILIWSALGIVALLFVLGLLRGEKLLDLTLTSVSLAVAAVPEGLPTVVTVALSLGVLRMSHRHALVRKLAAVETLGSVTVICTDKTGTLTRNEMTACVYALDQRRVDVTGTGYAPVGRFQDGDKPVDPRSDEHLALALRIGMLCNDAKVERTDGHDTVLGDPTEAALIVAAEKAGMNQADLAPDFPRISEVPFDSASKRMVTVHRAPQGRTMAFLKGSPGTLIAACSGMVRATAVTPLTVDDRRRWEETNEKLAGAALRVLGLAYRELPEGYTEDAFSKELTFVGLVGMSDPLRDEAKAAIATCREAGIRTVMITGDQQPTAAEIARQLGIDRNPDGRPLVTVHGRALTNLDAEGWKRTVADAAVFARVSPEHKLQIVDALQQQGHVVAMTGDGVNDAPALKKADIGIAMGIKGTEVAKENADMVITDDNFASIVGAVEQGRIIYGNILRFLQYLLSCNFSEILTVFLALMIGWPLPLVALQILWLNLITDIFPAFALALEPSAPDVMKRAPRDPQEPLLTLRFVGLIVWQGLLLAAVTLLAFFVGMHWHGTEGEGLRRATTMAFMTLAFAQVFHAFNARSQRRSAFTSRLFTNRWLWAAVVFCLILQAVAVYLPLLQKVLHTVPPSVSDWGVIAACSLMPVAVVEFAKVMTVGVRIQGGRPGKN